MNAKGSKILVLWDVDHTLIENGGVSKETYAGAYELLTGQAAIHRARTDGRTDPAVMRDLFEQHGNEMTDAHAAMLNEALERSLQFRQEELRGRGYALPGAREAITALGKLGGIIQTVLTGNIKPNAFIKVATFGLDPGLDFEVGGYGSDDSVRANLVGVARRRAEAKYGTSFDESTTVLIGDTVRDVRAGKGGGAYVIAVASGLDTVQELEGEGADVTLPNLVDTFALVGAVMAVKKRDL
ncbi:haloacid dehalogenase-like hydrolase [Streptosporangium subroseum]|uniref:HAD family hydrolase n=1 Tax=Streptosporangium subroseum TaxID=106412 RepID=UPI00343A8422